VSRVELRHLRFARQLDIATLRAGWWTFRASRSARRQLRDTSFEVVDLPPVPPLPSSAELGVLAVLRLRRERCLVQATIRQAWFAAQGSPRDLVIGVTAPSGGFRAHAWLDGDPPCHEAGFQELVRRGATST
jgi:hypothetical protein